MHIWTIIVGNKEFLLLGNMSVEIVIYTYVQHNVISRRLFRFLTKGSHLSYTNRTLSKKHSIAARPHTAYSVGAITRRDHGS